MPKCMGLPNGPCPANRNDYGVRLGEGDLMLCADCDKTRHSEWLASRATTSNSTTPDTNTTSMSLAAGGKKLASTSGKAAASTTPTITGPAAASNIGINNLPTSSVKLPDIRSSQIRSMELSKPVKREVTIIRAQHNSDADHSMVLCNDLLAYVSCYRDCSNVESLKRVVLRCFSSDDISVAKRLMCFAFMTALENNPLMTERRNSTSRAAHEAEVDDIIGLFDAVDAQNCIDKYMFVADGLMSLPKYGPEETNIASVVDRQLSTESAVANLSAELNKLSSSGATMFGADLSHKQPFEIVQDIELKLDKLSTAVMSFLDNRSSLAVQRGSTFSSPGDTGSRKRAEPDRSTNIILFGVPEDKDETGWRSTVDAALAHVSGYSVDVIDMFRIGRYMENKARPILVKLRTIWDRRLIVNRSFKLKDYAAHIFIAPNEPLEVRRKRIIDRKKRSAEREGKMAEIVNGVLMVDGVGVYSMKDGSLRAHNV
jgi:hypothetical protein